VVLMHYQRSMSGMVWDAAQLEGNPFTFVEVPTLGSQREDTLN